MPRPPRNHAIARMCAALGMAATSLAAVLALPAQAGPLEQRIADRLQLHCAALTDPTARRECLTDLVAFRARHGLRTNPRRAVDDAAMPNAPAPPSDAAAPHGGTASPNPAASTSGFASTGNAVTAAGNAEGGGHGAHPRTSGAAPAVDAASPPALGNQGTLPPVQPILPLRIVQRRLIGYEAYVYRLSDGSVWEDVDGAHSRLRPNALVHITESRFTGGRFMVASNERRRVRPLVCNPAPNNRVAEHCRLLRDGPLTF